MRCPMLLALAVVLVTARAPGADAPLPKVADGWAISRVAEAPAIAYPTAVVVARDGTIYLGQDPMDMPGPPTEPIDSVVAIRDGKVSTFAAGLWSVMGLEWDDGTLFVVHAPFLSAFRDTDGDGKADRRVDLITGLGPAIPGFNGINDHVASGIRRGMDGFLYLAVGDKGIPRGLGRDGSTIAMSTGGVIRIRPDGSGLEVVSTGERNPLSVALTASDDIFTYGNDDDSKKWPNSLTHHIVGGHHGYPYEFLAAPDRALPIVAGESGGSGAQGIGYE
jgi:glucose/arabinose dehydrogenase